MVHTFYDWKLVIEISNMVSLVLPDLQPQPSIFSLYTMIINLSLFCSLLTAISEKQTYLLQQFINTRYYTIQFKPKNFKISSLIDPYVWNIVSI